MSVEHVIQLRCISTLTVFCMFFYFQRFSDVSRCNKNYVSFSKLCSHVFQILFDCETMEGMIFLNLFRRIPEAKVGWRTFSGASLRAVAAVVQQLASNPATLFWSTIRTSNLKTKRRSYFHSQHPKFVWNVRPVLAEGANWAKGSMVVQRRHCLLLQSRHRKALVHHGKPMLHASKRSEKRGLNLAFCTKVSQQCYHCNGCWRQNRLKRFCHFWASNEWSSQYLFRFGSIPTCSDCNNGIAYRNSNITNTRCEFYVSIANNLYSRYQNCQTWISNRYPRKANTNSQFTLQSYIF